MPDTLNFGGQVVYAAGGKVTIGPISAGQVLSYRLFGTITPGAQLTTATEDAFSFSPPLNYTMGARIWRPGKSLDVTYTGAPYQLPVAPPQGVTLTYQGEGLNGAGLPVQVGTYTLRVTVPVGHPFYTPGTTDYPFRIRRIQLMIRPDPNQEKYEGMDDPDVFTYTVSGLLPGDNVTGTLTRKPGEEPGNYEFRTSRLSAPSYYRLMIPDGSPQFTILPGGFDEDFFPFFPGYFDILRPIHQIVVKNDGTKLDVLLNASETLQVNYTRLGRILFGPDDAPRLVSPSLSWNKDTDQVLLRLMADAEINEDKGYQTDITGKPLWTRRKLLLTWLAVRGLQNTGMDAVSLQNKGAALSVSFQDLLGKRVADFIQAKGGSTQTARFALTIAPASDLTEAEQAAADHLSPVSATYRVSCQVLLGSKAYDIAHLLPSLHVSMEMESIAANLKRLNMYSADQFARQFQLTRIGEEKTSQADSMLITPFGEDELKQVPYPAMMMTRRYLTAPLTAPGLVQVTRNPGAPQPSPAADASPAPAGTKAP